MRAFESRLPFPELSEFINRVVDAAYDAEDVLDKLEYSILKQGRAEADRVEVRKIFAHAFTIVKCFLCFNHEVDDFGEDDLGEVAGRFGDMVAGLREMFVKYSKCVTSDDRHDTIAEHQVTDQRERTPVRSGEPELVGRVDEKTRIQAFLLGTFSNKYVKVLPIVGRGGVGKTALTWWVFNDPVVKQHFHVKDWVCVSEAFEAKRHMAELLAPASAKEPQNFQKFQNLDGIQEILRRKLEGNRFLIVFDDMREVDINQWGILLRALRRGERGSKVLITTRNSGVADWTRTEIPLDLKGLSSEHCGLLLRRYAFGDRNILDHLQLGIIARKIVSRLGGLPLAAKAVGSLLQSHFSVSYWTSILHKLQRIDAKHHDVLPPLEICYEELPGHLKQCFSYCSLFPKDYIFEKDRLVRIWMAQGFVLSSQGKKLEDTGRENFDELEKRFFFEKNKYQPGYVIHDLLHDVARHAARDDCRVIEDSSCEAIPRRVRHLHLRTANHDQFHNSIREGKQHIRSLVVEGQFEFFYVTNVLKELKALRVFILSGVGVQLLPESIGELIHLRYIELNNIDIVRLPDSICRLYHLQGLDVRYCQKVISLPSGLHNLVNLRHLKQ